ncbi:MAG: ABC transporter ATP-binding protein [Peptococcaceae bacterium]|nr:ABC transporter ATP-binding protein [Peptococcaceae bacterium]
MIKVEHLTKYYGDFLAIKDLSFEIKQGHVYGFLGPNGAGKTTTMNIMTGCLSATSGHVFIDGYDIFEEPDQAKRLIGYLPEHPPLYMNETPLEYLRFIGEAKGIKGTELSQQIEHVVEIVRIADVKERRIADLSKGYKQRVGIAQALLGSPKVIILDEPTVGLDPIQIIEIRDLIQSLGKNHTVILSSHILSEVQVMCEKILIISHGQLVAFDTPEKLEQNLLNSDEINLITDSTENKVKQMLSSLDGITKIMINHRENDQFLNVCLAVDNEDLYDVSRRIFFAFAECGVPLLEMNLTKASLEDIFIELTDNERMVSNDIEK